LYANVRLFGLCNKYLIISDNHEQRNVLVKKKNIHVWNDINTQTQIQIIHKTFNRAYT